MYFNILNKISFTKIINFVKIQVSYFFSLLLRKSFRWGLPYSLSIEPTNICNLKCPECPSGNGSLNRNKGHISINTYTQIIDETYPYLLNLFLYFQGEPFINKQIFELINYASKKNIYTATSTNGLFLSLNNSYEIIKSGLDKLIISVDGTTQQVYEQYRVTGKLDKVITGIKNLVSVKNQLNSKTPFIELQFLVLGTNEHQKDDFLLLGKKLKVDSTKLKTAQIYDYKNGSKFIPQNNKYSRYKKQGDKYILKNKLKNNCYRLWNSTVITIDGEMLACCFDKDAKYSFGNVNKNSILELSNNNKFNEFANIVLKNRKQIDICTNCITP